MIPTDTEPTTRRACDACGTLADYTPLRLRAGGPDIFARQPFVCDACDLLARQREEAAARDAIAARRTKTWEQVIPEKYRATDLGHPDFNRAVWQILRGIDPLRQPVGLIGPAGRCKSRMLALFAKRLIAADVHVSWTNANRFQWAAQREFDDREGPEARRLLARWKTTRVLMLDDLGKQRWTDTVEAAFFDLLEYRSSHALVTHWSANPNPTDAIGPAQLGEFGPDIVARALDSTGHAAARARFQPILSRLLENTQLIPVP
jgi:hypothetical protein